MMTYSKSLISLVNTWVDFATARNLSGKGTDKQVMTFNLYQNLDLLKFCLIQQAIKDGVINCDDPKGLSEERQLQMVAEVVYQLKGNIFEK